MKDLKCSNCGNNVKPNETFCMNCGTKQGSNKLEVKNNRNRIILSIVSIVSFSFVFFYMLNWPSSSTSVSDENQDENLNEVISNEIGTQLVPAFLDINFIDMKSSELSNNPIERTNMKINDTYYSTAEKEEVILDDYRFLIPSGYLVYEDYVVDSLGNKVNRLGIANPAKEWTIVYVLLNVPLREFSVNDVSLTKVEYLFRETGLYNPRANITRYNNNDYLSISGSYNNMYNMILYTRVDDNSVAYITIQLRTDDVSWSVPVGRAISILESARK